MQLAELIFQLTNSENLLTFLEKNHHMHMALIGTKRGIYIYLSFSDFNVKSIKLETFNWKLQ